MMLSSRERWIAIATAVVVGLLLLDRVLLSPLLKRLDAANAQLQQHQDALRRADQLFDNRLRAQRRWRDMAGKTLASDAPTAESQVLNRAREWAQAAGLTLTSLKPERNERERDFQKITIRATGTGTMSQVSRFVYATQVADIPIRITDIQILARRDGTDDLSLQVGLATIYMPGEPARVAAAAAQGGVP
jgi:type II secretory pathway component PulM